MEITCEGMYLFYQTDYRKITNFRDSGNVSDRCQITSTYSYICAWHRWYKTCIKPDQHSPVEPIYTLSLHALTEFINFKHFTPKYTLKYLKHHFWHRFVFLYFSFLLFVCLSVLLLFLFFKFSNTYRSIPTILAITLSQPGLCKEHIYLVSRNMLWCHGGLNEQAIHRLALWTLNCHSCPCLVSRNVCNRK